MKRLFCILTVLTLAAAAKAESETFPMPGIIKHNVAFWVRIYTEVSLKEGLLHDRDFPQIVYEKSPTGDRTGKARSEFISGRMQIYIDAITAVRDSAPEKWGAAEKRVAEMFKSAPEGAIDSAEARIRHQTGQRERFKQGLERSSMYLDTISAILKQHGVPDELKYLPHVESSFDAEAYSKVGAAGLWQFMRATGRLYMKVDYMIDERSDPIISSHAAAKFLRANHDMLKTWPLAITAYNHGPNGMRRATETLGTRDIAVILEKHESASFKFASKNFYACFLAVLQIMEEPERYVKNINYKPRWAATNVRLPAAMTPNTLIKTLNVTEQELKRLNPSFRPVVFTQQKAIPEGYAINLPVSMNADEALAALKRPVPASVASAQPPKSAGTASVASATTPAPKAAEGAKAAEREIEVDADGYYTIVRGDNLNSIAKRLGVSMNDLAKANNINNSSKIFVGQVLLIPVAGPVSAPKASTDTATVAASKASPPKASIPAVQVIAPAKADTVLTVPVEPPKIREVRISVSSSYDTTWTRVASATKPVGADTAKPALVDAAKPASTASIIDTAKAKTTDTLSPAAAFRVAEAIPTAPVSPTGKPAIDTRFDANVYDLGMTVAPGGSSVQVRVSVGESISHLADWMRINNDDIRRLNNLEPGSTALPLGRLIDIPIKSSTNIKRFEVSRLQYHMAIEEDFFSRYDVIDFERRKVKSGDNLWRICADAQTPMWLLKKFNRGVRFYDLRVGDNLWIPKVSAKDSSHEVPADFITPVGMDDME